ncbi:OsmC family protein [Microbacteriaceae bacterium 4G12]
MKLVITNERITTDLPYGELHMDKDNGFTPLELLIASIAGCSGIVFRTILGKKRITYEELTIDTEIERAEEAPRPLTAVHLHYKIKGANLQENQVTSALKLVGKHCTIAQSVKESIKITETIEVIQS